MGIVSWIKSHKLITLLLLAVIYLISSQNNIGIYNQRINYGTLPDVQFQSQKTLTLPSAGFLTPPQAQPFTSSREVIKNSDLSILVKDVKKTGDEIINYAKQAGGYMVLASYTKPSESPFGSITVRVPTSQLDKSLSYFRSLGIKVTSENLVGYDITNEYTDTDARIKTLNKTKAKFEDILDKAINISDILSVQRELINLQDQIDMYVGQKKAMDENLQLTRISIYLSTDELALPYTPDKVFRPGVIFKQALRSLFQTLQSVGEGLIWVAVFSPIWGTAIGIYILINKRKNNKLN